ncbi:MAG: hypothetical protein KDB67_20640 [Gordonia sp.]|uniref:hypothetical protein n=1 Tax=Gordonia sp. (in: high G+C Gram-positive bacteria) TaxID=84139 RepID=UPI001DDC8709|nr:hypothetical protein [Gordonia sp. (in: high G+C Gram-positive bacteria)]MCB1297056.1 hypothetical protein [Gordonia sp. (in: high G+C Gram-positive bacteria)]HQV17571.1 hypothetical protein [Gordonia sp. (in: high G+C Gram-positive bacteria)]
MSDISTLGHKQLSDNPLIVIKHSDPIVEMRRSRVPVPIVMYLTGQGQHVGEGDRVIPNTAAHRGIQQSFQPALT